MGCCASSSANRAELMRSTPFFLYTSQEELEQFASHCTIRKYKSSTVIFTEKSTEEEFYIVAAGEVHISALDEDGFEQYLCSKKPGEFFGEEAIVVDHQLFARRVRVTTITDSVVLFITRKSFQKFRTKHPKTAEVFMSIMGEGMLNFLKKVPFLKDISSEKLQLLSHLFHFVSLEPGHDVFKEGDEGTEFYIVSQGSVRLFAVSNEGKETDFGTVGPGGYFGEIALMISIPRTATVQAIEKTLLLSLTKFDFRNFLLVAPELKEPFEKVAKERTANHFKKFNVPFFASIPPGKFHSLAQFCEIEHFRAGESIFRQGDPGTSFYLIAFGHLDVYFESNNERSLKKSLMPGQYFGELALVDDSPRPATIIARTNVVLMSITKDNFEHFFLDSPEAYAEFCIKLTRHDSPLSAILAHPKALKYFHQFLQKEYSTENLHFWMRANDFDKIADETKRKEEGFIIYKTFIDTSAPEQLNIPFNIREELIKQALTGTFRPKSFEIAVKEIYKLMERDSLTRFKQSKLFEQLLDELGSYDVLVHSQSHSHYSVTHQPSMRMLDYQYSISKMNLDNMNTKDSLPPSHSSLSSSSSAFSSSSLILTNKTPLQSSHTRSISSLHITTSDTSNSVASNSGEGGENKTPKQFFPHLRSASSLVGGGGDGVRLSQASSPSSIRRGLLGSSKIDASPSLRSSPRQSPRHSPQLSPKTVPLLRDVSSSSSVDVSIDVKSNV